MSGLKLTAFSGIAPKAQSRLLPDNGAQIADNCRLTTGALSPWRKPLQIASNTLTSSPLSIFKMESGASRYWLSWAGEVDCVRSLIAGDEAQRIYYTGDGEPRMSNYALAVGGGSGIMPASFFVLGVTAPIVAPTVTPTGGSGVLESRAYIETFVTQYGEESAPSPVSSVASGYPNATWTISALNAAPINTAAITGATHSSGVVTVTTASTKHLRVGEKVTHASIAGMTDLNGVFVITEIVDTTHYKVALTTAQTYTSGGSWTRVAPHNTSGMTRRIYRALSGVYRFVAEIAVGTTSYVDAVADSALGEECPSISWAMPPVDMTSLTVHPGGFLIGVSKNEICCSDPWHPHAWPVAYRQTEKFPLVGVGVFASTIVACTTGTPSIYSGSHPDSLSAEHPELLEPCLSKRSILDVGHGIVYASPNGIAFVGIGGARTLTANIMDRTDWIALNPSGFHFSYYNGSIIGMTSTASSSERSGFVFDMANERFSSLSVLATATFKDPEDGKLYLATGGVIKEWDADSNNNETFDWESKVFSLPKPVNMGWAKIDADFALLNSSQSEQIAAQNAADLAWNTTVLASGKTYGMLDDAMLDEYMLDGSLLRGGEINGYVTRFLRMSVYADGNLKYTEPVLNANAFSLPSGYKSALYEVRISGNVEVYGATIAETAIGLRNV